MHAEMMCRLNLFHDYAKRRWGEVVVKILLQTGIPCPNRERGGCIYCSAKSFTPYYLAPGDDIPTQIAKGKEYISGMDARRFVAGFQIETSTAGNAEELLRKYEQAWHAEDCAGLIISTRPDYVSEEQLDLLACLTSDQSGKLVLIELGLQSARDESLLALNRNHSYGDFVRAAEVIRKYDRFELGCHLILGIPGETVSDMQHSIHAVCDAGIQHLKLHHLQVIRDTPLEAVYRSHPFPMPDADTYIGLLCQLIPEIKPHVVIHRLWSSSKSDYLIAPRWNLPPNRLFERLFRQLELLNIRQGHSQP